MKQKILELREQGKSYNEISKILGCSKGTVSYHCSKLDYNKSIINENLKIKNASQLKISLLSKEIEVKIIELRKLKNTFPEISKSLGISIDIVSNVCKKFGLTNKRRFFRDEVFISKIKELYLELKSYRKVAKELNISGKTVIKYADKREITKLSEDELRSNAVKNVIDWRKRKKLELIEYKGSKCCICGYNKCVQALQFHHLDPKMKDFTISKKSFSIEKLKKEVDKCILVCANCHSEIHANLVVWPS